jgi:hypothetical protein
MFPLFCSFVLLAGPACASSSRSPPASQARVPADRARLPADQLDRAVRQGDWLFDTQTGCRMWDWHPEPEDKPVWSGACRAGQPNGPGEAQWTEHGRPIDRFVGTYRDGKREGPAPTGGTTRSVSRAATPTTCRRAGAPCASTTSC